MQGSERSLQDPVGARCSSLSDAGTSLSAVPGTERWSQNSWRSLIIGQLTEDGALDGGLNSLCRTERSTEDGTFNRGLGSLRRTELLTEDGGALLKTGLLTEDVALDAGRNCQLRTERSTEGGAFNAGLGTRWKTERSSQDLFAWRSSLSGAAARSTLFSILYR